MSAQSGDSPLLRPQNPFQRRTVNAISAAKPGPSVGIATRPLPGGTSITSLERRSRGSGGGATPGLFLWTRKVGAGEYMVSGGMFNNVAVKTVTIGGDELSDDDEDGHVFELTTGWIWLAVEYSPVFVEGFLTTGTTYTGAYVKSGSTVPADTPLTGKFYERLARIVSDVITQNYGGTNLSGLMRDNSTLSSSSAELAIIRR